MIDITKQQLKIALINFVNYITIFKSNKLGLEFEKVILQELKVFLRHCKPITTTSTSAYNKAIKNYESGRVIIAHHPNGTNKFPDIKVHYNDIDIDFEVKSSKDGTIHWNSTMVKPDTIYIYNYVNPSKGNDIIIFCGKDYREMNNKNVSSSINYHIEQVETLTSNFKEALHNNDSRKFLKDKKIIYYIRENWKSNANLLKKPETHYTRQVKQFINSKLK